MRFEQLRSVSAVVTVPLAESYCEGQAAARRGEKGNAT
jgi:hypothetical protein